MFSEPTINSVKNLFNAPGLGLELFGAGVLICGVFFYMVRVAWISLSQARRMEADAMRLGQKTPHDTPYSGPYCAG